MKFPPSQLSALGGDQQGLLGQARKCPGRAGESPAEGQMVAGSQAE